MPQTQETLRERYDRITENNPNFWGNVTKRLGRISYEDWLHYASRFLKTFDSSYEGTSNVVIKTGVYVPVGLVESHMASQGSTPDELRDMGDVILQLEAVKLNGNSHRILREALPESLFREVPSIRVRIDPNDETEKFVYAFGNGDFTRRKPKYLSFYAQGSGRLIHTLHEEFTPKSLTEIALYRLVDDIGYHLGVFGK